MSGSDPSLEQRVARLERLVERLLEEADADTGRPDAADPAEPSRPEERRAPGSHQWSWQRTSAEPEGSGPAPPGVGGAGAGASGRGGAGAAGRGGAEAAAGPEGARAGPAAEPKPARGLADHGERWLGRVGVAFVILAFGFLFKYAFDQGWIGPAFRLVLGFVAATAMLGIGLRLEGSRERYSQYLLGGAIGVYYLVGFASYELYELVPFWVAFAFMCATTVLAFVLAERQRLPSLAVIGAAGGLSTPFLVNTGSGNVPALVAYTTLLLAGAGSIQFLRGWRGLLLVLGFGGLTVMALAVDLAEGAADVVEASIVVVGILAAWAVFGVLPLFRAHLQRTDPETWPEPPLPDLVARIAPLARLTLTMLRIGCVAAPFFAVLELGALFSAERETFGVLYGVGFLVYAVLARALMGTRLALDAAAETASILLVLAITLVFFDYRVMLPLAVTGAAMHTLHARLGLPGVAVLAHLLFAQLLLLVLGRIEVVGVASASPFGVREMGALGAIVLAFTSTFTFSAELAKQIYRVSAHAAFMVWLATQFAPMERGRELISLSWGVYGIALLLISLRLRRRGVQLAGLATLGVVAGKLLLVDMAQVDVIWRILLFMGFGAAFLGLSYLINREAEASS